MHHIKFGVKFIRDIYEFLILDKIGCVLIFTFKEKDTLLIRD